MTLHSSSGISSFLSKGKAIINNEQPQPKDSKQLTDAQKADLQARTAAGEFDLATLKQSLKETLQSPPATNPANPVEVPPGKTGSKFKTD